MPPGSVELEQSLRDGCHIRVHLDSAFILIVPVSLCLYDDDLSQDSVVDEIRNGASYRLRSWDICFPFLVTASPRCSDIFIWLDLAASIAHPITETLAVHWARKRILNVLLSLWRPYCWTN
jgi:hypothetical protein